MLPRSSSLALFRWLQPLVAFAAVVLFAVVVSGQDPVTTGMRTWTNNTGKFKVEAKLRSASKDKVKLEKSDGLVIELPFEKLSTADQALVRRLQQEVADEENPFAGGQEENPFADNQPISSKPTADGASEKKALAKTIKVELPSNRQSMIVPAWSVDVGETSQNMSRTLFDFTKPIEVNTFGGRYEFHNDAEPIIISPKSSIAVTSISNPFEDQTLVTVVDLLSGTEISKGVFPSKSNKEVVSLTYNNDRQELITLTEGEGRKKGKLDFRPIDDLNHPIVTWETASFFDNDVFDPRLAYYMGDDQLLTLGDHIVLWDIDSAEAHYAIKMDNSRIEKDQVSFSPNRKLVAISGRQYVYLIDVVNGVVKGKVNQRATSVSFSPDGRLLAGKDFTGKTWVWDLSTNSLIQTFTSQAGRGPIHWVNDRLLLVNGKKLYDIEFRVCVWNYQTDHNDVLASLGGGQFLVQRKNQLKLVNLPHTDFSKKVEMLDADDLQLIKPGSTFSLDLDLSVYDANQQNTIRATLESSIEKQGFSVDRNADLVIRGSIRKEKQQTVKVRDIGFGGFGAFGRRGVESMTFTPHRTTIQILKDEKSIWTRSYYHGPSMLITEKDGESLQQYAERVSKPNPRVFSSFKIPTNVSVLPGGKPFGQSRLWDSQ